MIVLESSGKHKYLQTGSIYLTYLLPAQVQPKFTLQKEQSNLFTYSFINVLIKAIWMLFGDCKSYMAVTLDGEK